MRSFSKNSFSAHLLYGLTSSNIEYLAKADPILKIVCMIHLMTSQYSVNKYNYMNNEDDNIHLKYGSMLSSGVSLNIANHQLTMLESYTNYNVFEKVTLVKDNKVTEGSQDVAMVEQEVKDEEYVPLTEKYGLEVVRPLVLPTTYLLKREITNFNKRVEFYQSKLDCCPADVYSSSSSFANNHLQLTYNIFGKQFIAVGSGLRPSKHTSQGKLLYDHSTLLPTSVYDKSKSGFSFADEFGTDELMHSGSNGYSKIQVPDFRRLINDCGKMSALDSLLKKLFAEKHRCLIFCQMTKMMDIIEEYLSWMQYSYFRMDGSTQINDRRDMVDEYQSNENIFCFLLSTRAGGLGITLTGADTVIFYDSDWNPTIDAQATDRAHRIGQTKEVSVYRLITKHTIEENIVKRAKQKENVQSTVYAGGALRADTLKPSEFVGFLVDEENEEENEPGAFIKTKKRGKKQDKAEEENKDGMDVDVKEPSSDQHKIQYHYLSKQDRPFTVNQEDEAKAKEALKLLKNQKLNDEAEEEDDEDEDDEEDLNEQFKHMINEDLDQGVKFNDEEEDQLPVDEE